MRRGGRGEDKGEVEEGKGGKEGSGRGKEKIDGEESGKGCREDETLKIRVKVVVHVVYNA